MQHNLRLSATVIAAIRRFDGGAGIRRRLDADHDERYARGRRDFLVPRCARSPAGSSRSPQSPQLFKQTFVIVRASTATRSRSAGGTRICAPTGSSSSGSSISSSPSLTREDVLGVLERSSSRRFEALGRTPPRRPLPADGVCTTRCCATAPTSPTCASALGDPADATDVTRDSEFEVFARRESVQYLVAPQAFSRGELQRLEELAKEWGAAGSRVSGLRRVRRGALADRQVPLRGEELGACPTRRAVDSALRRRRARRWWSVCSQPRSAHLGQRARASSTSRVTSSSGSLDFPLLLEWDEDSGPVDVQCITPSRSPVEVTRI